MIYIIINQSHEWDDEHSDGIIEFVGTSLEQAEKIWNETYSKITTFDDSKWYQSVDLREYNDGYFLYGLENSSFTVLKHIDNIEN